VLVVRVTFERSGMRDLRRDHVRALRYEYLHRSTTIGAAIVIVVAALLGIATDSARLIVVAAAAGLTMLYLIAAFPGSAWRKMRARVRGHEIVYTLSEEGVDVTQPSVHGSPEWAKFKGAARTRDAYLLRLKSRRVLIVPRRAFDSPADEETFCELVDRKTGSHLRDGRGETRSAVSPR
jgi:hypothetical protein